LPPNKSWTAANAIDRQAFSFADRKSAIPFGPSARCGTDVPWAPSRKAEFSISSIKLAKIFFSFSR
jgi:hypothetical protein